MTRQELDKCLKHLNMSEASLLKLVGCRDARAISSEQARCIRALVLKKEIRELVEKWRAEFPEMTMTGIRTLDDDER